MPLSFVNPALLFGALASALPVIIHFLSRRKVQRRPFSDLRFLTEVQARQTRRLSTRRWLLLLLRVLAILLLTLAVAGPRWGGLGGGLADHSVMLVLDTSASMGTQEEGGTRLEQAIRDGRRMISLLPPSTSVQILTAGAVVKPLLGDWLPAGSVPPDAFKGITPDAGGFDIEAVLEEAFRQVRSAPGSALDLVLLSDMQKVRRRPDLKNIAARLLERQPVHILVRQTGQAAPGGGILNVDLPRRSLRAGENITIEAVVRPDTPEQPFTLEIDGVAVGETVPSGQVAGAQILTYSLTVPGPGWHRGLVRKKSDLLPADDSRPFVLFVPEQVNVVLVHGPDRPADGPAGRGGWRFLQQALDPGTAGSLFRIKAVTGSELVTGDLDRAGLLVLVDPDHLGRTALDGITAWVRAGGGVLLVAGDPVLQGYLQQTLLPALGFSGEKLGFQSRAAGLRTHLVGRSTPLFTGFDQKALGTLEDVTWRRWFSLQDQGAEVLLSLAGGDPLVLMRELDSGRVMIMAANLRPESGDLAGSAMALPLLQRMAAWLSAGTGLPGRAGIFAGQEVLLEPHGDWASTTAGPELKVWLPGAEKPVPALLDWRGSRPVLRGRIAEQAGFAVFTAGLDTLGVVAVGVPPSESGLVLETPDQWRRRLGAEGLSVGGDLSGTAPEKLGSLLRGRNLAPWLFLLTVMILMLELYLGRGSATADSTGSG